jgi:hypothetical protein
MRKRRRIDDNPSGFIDAELERAIGAAFPEPPSRRARQKPAGNLADEQAFQDAFDRTLSSIDNPAERKRRVGVRGKSSKKNARARRPSRQRVTDAQIANALAEVERRGITPAHRCREAWELLGKPMRLDSFRERVKKRG